MKDPTLVLGTVYGQNKQLATIKPQDLLHHMLIVGQSGSGKSFLIARLIEEILLRTQARVVVIDPNGDFRRICDAQPSGTWSEFAGTFAGLAELTEKAGFPVFDKEEDFRAAWDTRRFQYIIANPDRVPRSLPFANRVRQSDLFIHWGFVSSDEQDFLIDLLNVDPLIKTKINLGVRACNEYLERLVAERQLPQGYGLLEVIRVADKFLARDINLGDHPYVKGLTTEDWSIVSANLQQLYNRHLWMWWNAEARGWEGNWDAPPRRTDMLGYLLRPFGRFGQADLWNACVIGLDRARMDDALLAVNLALFRLWTSSQHQWRVAESQGGLATDERVPTFIVIDEAHNYAPSEHRTPVQKRVTDKLIQIAAEGRKYGLYLILATQRPRKLHPHLVLECENCCLLRVQSKVEQEFLEKEFGIPHDEAARVGKYEKGHALLHGRWMDGKQVEATVAPARTVVAGGGVPDSWITAPNLEKLAVSAPGSEGAEVQEDVAEPEIATDGESPMPVASIAAQGEHLANRIAEVVRKTVAESLLPVPLSVLGIKLRGLFGSDVIEKTQWAGRLSLTSLVKSLQGPDLVYSPAAEGFVFDPARHDEPVHESVVERVKKTHPHLASLVDHLHYQFRLPLLAPSEYAIVFRILAEEARRNGYNLVQTAKAVRDASKTSGVQLSRPGINFILSRIHSSGYQVGEDSARTADELGRLYVVEVLSYCKQIGAELTATDEKSLKELILGEMSNPTLNSTATSESVVGTTQTTTNTTTAPVAESAP